jgi:hypothetical protein
MAKKEQIDILFKMHADMQQMKKLQQETHKTRKQLGDLGKLLKRGLGMTVGIASVGALTAVLKRNTQAAIENGAAIHQNAKLFGVSAEFLQTWRYAAEQNNMTAQQGDVALQRFTRRLGEAAKGKGELLPILQEYGIELHNLDGTTRSNTDVLGDFAEIMQKTTDPAERLRIAFKLFDSEGAKFASVLADGRDGLQDLQTELEGLGRLIDDKTVESLSEVKEAMIGFGAEMTKIFADATAGVWEFIEGIQIAKAAAEDDSLDRLRAVWDLAGKEEPIPGFLTSGPNAHEWRQSQIEMLKKQNGISDEAITAKSAELRIQRLEKEKQLLEEKRVALEKERVEIEAATDAEERRIALLDQREKVEAEIAAFDAKLAYERLDIQEKLNFQLNRRNELEEELNSVVLDQEDENKKLAEYRDTLKEIYELRLKGAGAGPETIEGGGLRSDPMQDFADRMTDAQNPQLILLNSMEAMYESINAQVQDLIAGTITWEQALRNVGGAVLSAVISTFAQMAAAAIASYLATQIGIKGMQAVVAKETMAMGGQAAAAWIPAAIAASIATLGGAAGVGAASFALAMLSGAAAATLTAGLAGAGMAAMGAGSSIPGRATGGPVQRGQLYKVGEQGEELFAPGMTGTIIPNDATTAIMAGLNSHFQAPRTARATLNPSAARNNQNSAGKPVRFDHTTINIDDNNPNALADALERIRGDVKVLKRRAGMV